MVYQLFALFLHRMRGSNASVSLKPTTKKPKTNSELTSRLLSNIHQNLIKQVSTGKIKVHPISQVIPNPKKQSYLHSSNPQDPIQDIQSNLHAIRSSIIEQKKAEKLDEKVRLLKAHQLIERMKKERLQHQQKLKQESEKSVLHRRIYSDTTINQMREQLEGRITNKRQELAERVRAIEERKNKRDQQTVNKQIQYWQHIKRTKQQTKSTNKLPAIAGSAQSNRNNNPNLQRKSSLSQLDVITSQSEKYSKQIDKFMQLAKMKQQNIRMKLSEQRNSRVQMIVDSHQKLPAKIQEESSKESQFLPYHANRQKIMGNEYLKESLLWIKKSSLSSVEQEDRDKGRDSLELEAHEALLNKNEKVERLKQKWERMLSKVKHSEISQEQGLELLNNIEKTLDRLDFKGVKQRLKKKYEMLSLPSDPDLIEPIEFS